MFIFWKKHVYTEILLIMCNVCSKGKKTNRNKCILISERRQVESYSKDKNRTGKTTGRVPRAVA